MIKIDLPRVLLWIFSLILFALALFLIALSLSAKARVELFTLLSDSPWLITLSALFPLAAAGGLLFFLMKEQVYYTFHSSLLTYAIDPKLLASTIETGWNQAHPANPISCHAGSSLEFKLLIAAPEKEKEKTLAEKLHAFSMQQLEKLLAPKQPVTFHIEWKNVS